MQAAETVAAMSEEKIKTHVPLWVFIVANVALACFTGHFLLKQLALGHEIREVAKPRHVKIEPSGMETAARERHQGMQGHGEDQISGRS